MKTKILKWLRDHIKKQNKNTKGKKFEWKIFFNKDQDDWDGDLLCNSDIANILIKRKKCYVQCYISEREYGGWSICDFTDEEIFDTKNIK